MLEYEGPLLRAALSKTLWLVLVGPVLGIAWQVLVARRRLARATGAAQRRELRQGGWAGVAGIFAAGVALLGHLVVLVRLPAGGRALYDHVVRGTRVPGLEAPLDLWLDPQAAVACGLACAVACTGAVLIATGPTFERTWTRWVWLQLALVGALLAFLADGLVTVAAGWTLAAAAGAWLAGWGDARQGIAAASWGVSAVAALLLGAALLFWGLGGTWDDEGYAPDPTSLEAVRVAGRAGEMTLSMTAPAGARVAVDGARTASLHVPFLRAPLGPGSHSIRFEGAETSETHFAAADGDDVVLVAVGPTLSLHAMRDVLSVRDRLGEPSMRREVEARVAPGGVSLVAGVLLLWLLATGALSAIHVPLASPGHLGALAGGVTSSLLGPYLLARVDFLFPSALHTGVVVACAGAAIVLGATWRALPHDGVQRWLVFTSGAAPGLVCVVLGLGGAGRALVGMGVVAAGVAALRLGTARRLFARDEEIVDADETFLIRVPTRLGALLTSMERWVIGSVADAAGGAARVAAWMVAAVDDHLVASPADRMADRVVRVSHSARPVVGGSLALVAWAIVALAATFALLHALWPGG